MTNKTIDGVPRRMLTALLCHVSELENRALVDELRALLAAPGPIVEADGMGDPVAWAYKREGGTLGQLVAMESSDLKDIRLGKCYDNGTRYVWPREDYINWQPLYSADQLAALQSTIAQLQAENERLRGGQGVALAPSREMRVYIAGPMTGIESYNFPAFNAMAEQMRSAGWHVENPADHGVVAGAEWGDYLRYDISRLSTCEAMMLLQGWATSRGARLEVSIAKQLGIALMYADGAEYEPVRMMPVCKLGIYGKAFEGPEVKRAYTYREQPDNLGASKLANAALSALKNPGGDSIDQGLALLKALSDVGFGVFEIDSAAALNAEYAVEVNK